MNLDSGITEYLLILKRNHNAIIKDIRDSALQIDEKSKFSLVENGRNTQIHLLTLSTIFSQGKYKGCHMRFRLVVKVINWQ